MAFDKNSLRQIYYRTDGFCHICGKKLSLKNYSRFNQKGAWEVEHSLPRANGGTDHMNNLYPACITCNRLKGTVSSRTARSWNGRKKAPLSRDKKKEEKFSNAVLGGFIGALFGLIGGPLGFFAGSAIGATLGYSVDPNKN